MNIDLSRRAGKISCSNVILNLDQKIHLEFVQAVSKAPNFDTLPAQWQELIVSAERNLEHAGTTKKK